METVYLFRLEHQLTLNFERVYQLYIPGSRLVLDGFNKNLESLNLYGGPYFKRINEKEELKLSKKIQKNKFKRKVTLDSSFIASITGSIEENLVLNEKLAVSKENLVCSFNNLKNFIK